MLVPLSWLRDFAPFDLEPSALAAVFDDLGMVVEAVSTVGAGLEDVVVAHVLEVDPIPDADKIRRIMVDAGAAEPVQIVCGAWNFGVGDDVPLAPVGAVLPGDFKIGRRKMKGVASEGMLCSARELGLGDDAAGLLVLPPGHAPGRPIRDALGITADIVFDLAIEANRPDANCVAGVARDAAARLGLPFAIPTPALRHGDQPTGFEVRVSAPDLCDRFNATVFAGIRVGPSPEWVARRLTLAGMRPISNVVDASNYVMLELGQPTHAYDLDRLPGPVLGARAASPGERITTLDGVERVLGGGAYEDCVIVDADDTVIGIAGVMGGASSEVHDATVNVVLETAHFVPMAIARTSKRLGLRSEASARFERGVDIEGIDRAVARFAELLGASTPGLVVPGPPVDWRAAPPGRTALDVRVGRVNAVLGTDLRASEITSLLEPIGFAVMPADAAGEGVLAVTPPSFRPDVTAEIDVVEEVARHHGYAKVARTTVRPPQVGRLTRYQRGRRTTRDVLVGAGLSEAMTSPLLGPGDHARTGLPETAIGAADPLVVEESLLRTSLRPGLLRAVAFNADRRTADVGLFEIGRVWPGGHVDVDVAPPDAAPGRGLPVECEVLGVVMAGAGADARAAVNVLRRLTGAFHADGVRIDNEPTPGLHPTRSAAVSAGGRRLGWVGEVDPAVSAAWGISGRVAWLEVELEPLVDLQRVDEAALPVSRFPSSDLDLAFVVPDSVAAVDVEDTLRRAAGDLLEWITLFDVYRGTGVADGARSLAYRLRFASPERTLTEADLAAVREACIAAVEHAHRATLRA